MTKVDKSEEILAAVKQVPLLSPQATRLLGMVATPDHGIGDLVDIVKCDSALTAKVLRVINSPIFGLIQPMTTVERALAYMGERMVVSIALSESAGKLLNKSLEGYESAAGTLWDHDLFTAIASREIARTSKEEMPIDLAYTSGLLHDIGKAVISDFLNEANHDLVGDIARGELTDFVDGERRLLGMDHAEIGYKLAQSWGLPEALAEAIAWHHHPNEAKEEFRGLVYAVHLGDILAMMGGVGTGSDGLQYQLEHGYQDYFDLKSNDLPLILMTAQDEFEKISAAMSGRQETP